MAAGILLLAACSSKKDAKSTKDPKADRNKPVTVQGFIVHPTTISESIEVPGNLLPYESTELHPEVAGRVVNLHIKEGSYVNKGSLLVKLFDGDLQAQVKKLEAQLRIAETTADRYGQLLGIGGISRQEYDLSRQQITDIQADIVVTKVNIGKTEIRAPFSGRIGLRNISTGAYVSPETVIATLQQTQQLKLEFTVPEKYTSRIATGQKVNFGIEGNTQRWQAGIMATESNVTADNRSLRIRAVVSIKHPALLPGVFAKVIVDLGDDKNALLVPSQAILPQARSKQVILYRAGIAEFVTVTTNVRDSARVQVTSGIQAGDTIVTTGLLAIKPGAKINISKIVNK